jgi:hypothetical protein
MTPDVILTIGIIICGAAVIAAAAAVIALRIHKAKLDKRLDSDYGKRRQAWKN